MPMLVRNATLASSALQTPSPKYGCLITPSIATSDVDGRVGEREGNVGLHWSSRNAPRDIFWVFDFGAAWLGVSKVIQTKQNSSIQQSRCRRGHFSATRLHFRMKGIHAPMIARQSTRSHQSARRLKEYSGGSRTSTNGDRISMDVVW